MEGFGKGSMATFDTCNGIIYTIKKGDTLYSISKRYNVPLAKILRANPYIDIYNLRIGEQICIPICPTCFPFQLITYIVKNAETLFDILNQFGIELEDFLKYNNLNGIELKEGTKVQIPMREENDE